MRNRDKLRTVVAANVRAELGRVNSSQSKAAAAIGMSQAALSKRLAGRLPFTVDELGDIADYLGVPVDAFFVTAPKAVAS